MYSVIVLGSKREYVKKSPEHCHREKKISGWVYKLDPAVLPEHTLRVLDLAHCRLKSTAAVSFPRLSSLRLYRCSSSTEDLEGLIRSTPSLRGVHIQDHNFYHESANGTRTRGSDRLALYSPSLTALTLLSDIHSAREHFELDVPRLRAFKYNGDFDAFSMKSHAAELARVDLTVHWIHHEHNDLTAKVWFHIFWKFMRRFQHVKAMTFKVPNIEGIAVVDKDLQLEHLVMLPALERLELTGLSDPGRRGEAALAIANLLQCCPVIQDLRIRIPTDPYKAHYAYTTNTNQVELSDFDVPMDVFRRRFSKEMVPLMLDRDDDNGSSQVEGLPGLTGCKFPCLQSHLKNVALQFELKELNSFEVCLVKFFAENCMVLEVLQIDDGKQNFLRHINWMAERWRANVPKKGEPMEYYDSADLSKQMGKRKHSYHGHNKE